MEKYTTLTRVINAPRSRVWEAWVDESQLAQWWAPKGFTNMALGASGETLMDGVTTVTFEDDGDKTKLTVHTGAGGTAPGVEQMLGGMEQGWSEQLDKLGAFVQK